MITHEPTSIFESYNPAVLLELDYNGQFLKERVNAEFENQNATLEIPCTIAHYISPSSSDVAFTRERVAQQIKSFGIDVFPVCGFNPDGTDLGLILEHQADSESEEFSDLIEEIKLCLHQLGWNYDGYVREDVEPVVIH